MMSIDEDQMNRIFIRCHRHFLALDQNILTYPHHPHPFYPDLPVEWGRLLPAPVPQVEGVRVGGFRLSPVI